MLLSFLPQKKKKNDACLGLGLGIFALLIVFFFNLNMVYQHIMQASPQAKQS